MTGEKCSQKIEVPLTPADKAVIAHAARLVGLPPAAFVRSKALEAARGYTAAQKLQETR